jgi:hypothetical protein
MEAEALMNAPNRSLRMLVLGGVFVLGAGMSWQTPRAQSAAPAESVGGPSAPSILTRDQAAAILPTSVFFRGQTASIQARNSSGLRLAGGRVVLAALVDTSGYSSGLAQTYQAYLITEVPLRFGDEILPPGAYGFGFVVGDRMVVMDVGGNEVLHAHTTRDGVLARPNPLQIVADAAMPHQYRFYLGRSYVSFAPALAP